MRILKGVIAFIMILLFSCGFSIFAYPYIHNYVVEKDMQGQVQDFWDQLATGPTEQESIPAQEPTESTETTETPRDHEELWNAMVAYNNTLWEEKQAGLCDPWSYQQPSFTLGEYGLEEEVFGVISIPALDLEMPLYLGATPSHMAKGAAHLSQTSLPIGGMNTNCVIAGHRGYNGAAYFRYITELKPGDEVIITNLWETMTYTVTDTKIIKPNEVDQILIQEGRDMITLLTCHPYASGGKQRFLTFCDRVIEEGGTNGINN